MIVIKDKLCKGKGEMYPENFLKCDWTWLDNIHVVDFAKHNVVILHYNEIHGRLDLVRKAAKKVLMQNPRAVIVNNILDIDIGNKTETFEKLSHVKILGLAMPKFWRICKKQDLTQVELPVILKQPRATGGNGGDCLLTTQEDLHNAYSELIERGELLAIQFINSKDDTGVYHKVRVHFVNNKLLDIWDMPSREWNIHVKDRAQELIAEYNKKLDKWVATLDIQSMLDNLYTVLGPGWYVMDCVWNDEGLWFCEVGYKIISPTESKPLAKAGLEKPEIDMEGIYKTIKGVIASL